MTNGMKTFVYLGIIILIAAIGLTSYNKNIEKEAIENATMLVGETFKAKAEYEKYSNRIIVEKYIKDEEELFKITKQSFPFLTQIGEYDVVNLLSMRGYYGENKSNPQFYDIKFKNIDKIKWEKIRNFDDFLNEINKYN